MGLLNLKKRYGDWALVTGGHTGIGYALSAELASEGLNIVLCARTREALDAAADKIKATSSVEVRVVVADCSSQAGVDALIEATSDLAISIVIPNAGVECHGWFVEETAEAYRWVAALARLPTLTRGWLIAEAAEAHRCSRAAPHRFACTHSVSHTRARARSAQTHTAP
jgi:NAD(P)-dependent dehydrogenase (short-subunit alcohol dehydrogenase family)